MYAYMVPMTFDSRLFFVEDVREHGTKVMNNGDIVWVIQPHDMPHTTFWAYRIELV